MCSIYGAVGSAVSPDVLRIVATRARDRGRDGGKLAEYDLGGSYRAFIGNWRATPTPEIEAAPPQPYGGIVHNGTIANDKELGAQPGEVDSMVLPRIIDRRNIYTVVASLKKVRGSYALAIVGRDRLFLAANYKPIYFIARQEGVYFSSMERHLAYPVTPWGCRPQKLDPYSVADLRTGEIVPLPRESAKRAVVICSGGLDSTTAAWKLKADGYEVALLHFRYGCKAESREVQLVAQLAERLGAPFHVLDIDYSAFKGGSRLLTDAEISGAIDGAEYAHEWVPARNLLMIAHAVAFAEGNGYGAVALGNNLEEAGAYPDNEEEFTTLLDRALDYAVHDGGQVRLLAPLGHLMKHEIVALGTTLGVPYELTWSCYRGGNVHCGRCGPCYMRKTAFTRTGRTDPVFAHELADV